MHYRVHSRQMLCIGGSQIPFGWSFLSIAKVPMTWSDGDIWTADVRPEPCLAGPPLPMHQTTAARCATCQGGWRALRRECRLLPKR